jgi:hypothetical protein
LLPSIHVLFGDSGTSEFDRNFIFAGSGALPKSAFHDLGRNVLEQAPLFEFLSVLSATGGILARELSTSAIAHHQAMTPGILT